MNCIEGTYCKQECSQNAEPPILLQPSFQSVHHVSRFNPTVPHPEANRILSQSIMLIAKELACPWGNCGKILQGFQPHPQCHCKLQGRREQRGLCLQVEGMLAVPGACCEEEAEGSSNRWSLLWGFTSREQHGHSLPLISANDPITNFFL